MHTTSYEKAEKLCREIGERPLTDDETRAKLLRNAVMASPVSNMYIIIYCYKVFIAHDSI